MPAEKLKSGGLCLALLFAGTPLLSLHADILFLKNGRKYEGVIVYQSRTAITIQSDGKKHTIPKKQLRRITFGPVKPAAEREAEKKRAEKARAARERARKAAAARRRAAKKRREEKKRRAELTRKKVERTAAGRTTEKKPPRNPKPAAKKQPVARTGKAESARLAVVVKKVEPKPPAKPKPAAKKPIESKPPAKKPIETKPPEKKSLEKQPAAEKPPSREKQGEPRPTRPVDRFGALWRSAVLPGWGQAYQQRAADSRRWYAFAGGGAAATLFFYNRAGLAVTGVEQGKQQRNLSLVAGIFGGGSSAAALLQVTQTSQIETAKKAANQDIFISNLLLLGMVGGHAYNLRDVWLYDSAARSAVGPAPSGETSWGLRTIGGDGLAVGLWLRF